MTAAVESAREVAVCHQGEGHFQKPDGSHRWVELEVGLEGEETLLALVWILATVPYLLSLAAVWADVGILLVRALPAVPSN